MAESFATSKSTEKSAARLLLDRIERRNASAPVQQVMLSYTIQERASV